MPIWGVDADLSADPDLSLSYILVATTATTYYKIKGDNTCNNYYINSCRG